MRCKHCGSKAIYPYKNHEQGGAGRVIAGAIIAGPVGALAGFAGKNVKGYRCSACGMFSEQAMDFNEELSIDSAVRSAQNGNTLSYERYRQKYANLEFVPIQQTTSRNTTRLTTDDYDEELENEEISVVDEPADDSVKHSYNPGQYVVGAPVFISNVTIKDDDGTDVLLLEASNISEKTLRSVYLTLTVYDDVGDQISTNTFAYQGLQAAPGESLQQAKPFKLNTNVAYKVDVTCEKAAFTDDSVWRKEENPTVYSVVDKTELTPEGFAQYKYLRALLDKKSTLPSDRKLYYPVVEETHRLCVCGTPVTSGSKCPVCGLDEDGLGEVMDYDVLRQARKDLIASTAQARTAPFQAQRKAEAEKNYQSAKRLMDQKSEHGYRTAASIFELMPDYKDSAQQAELCLVEAEECRKAETYQKAQALLTKKTEKSCKEAAKIFASLSGYKDSAAKAEHCIAEAEVCRKDEIYNKAHSFVHTKKINALENAIAEFQKIPGWKDADEQVTNCQQRIEDLKVKEEAARQERERQEKLAKEEAAAAEEARQKRNKLIAICAAAIALIVIFIYILVGVIIPNKHYNAACSLIKQGQYEDAIAAFEKLNGYKDSEKQIEICEQLILQDKYDDGIALLQDGKYEEAYSVFQSLGDFSDSAEQCKETRYQLAMTYWNKQEYEKSNPVFEELGLYKDSKQKIHTHDYTTTTITAPGCETKGEEKLTCKTCPYSYNQPVNATGHTYGEKQITKAPTCTAEGEHTTLCNTCNRVITEAIPMLNHNYSSTITKVASCEVDGVKTFSCKCGKNYTEAIKATGHSYNGGVVTAAATCDKNGVKTFSCKCGKSYTEAIKATGHSYNGGVVTAAATCEKNGVKTFSCKCGKSYTEAIKATGHSYNNGVVTTAATCDKNGVKTFSCKCGKSYTETINAIGHKYSEATCTSASVCANCNHTQQSALGHNNQDNRCSRCNLNLTATYTGVCTSGDNTISFSRQDSDVQVAYGTYRITITVTDISDKYLGHSLLNPSVKIYNLNGYNGIVYHWDYPTLDVGAVFTYEYTYREYHGNRYGFQVNAIQCTVNVKVEPIA